MRKRAPTVLLLRRRIIYPLLALVLAGGIFCATNYPATINAAASQRQLPIYCVDCKEKRCSISFDAAWGNEDTQTLIDILDKYHIKATFFLVGDWVDKYPESVKALSDAGMEIMSHSDHHDHYNSLSSDQIIADVQSSCDKIEKLTGAKPTLIRCPYGEYDDHVISAIRSMGMEPIQWDVDSLDWKDLDANAIYDRVTKSVAPGSIVLFHNAALHTPEALPSILEYMIKEGYTIVPISELILDGEYTIDHTGRQCPAADKSK